MEINNLEMISFRNHRKTYIDFDPGLTIIWGENGSGKTSILEAIHSLSFGKSFRTNNKNDLIKKGEESFYLKGDFKNKNKKHKKDLEKKKNEVIEMQSRQEIVQELKVRSTIKRMLHVQKVKMIKDTLKRLEESFRIRNILNKLINESDVEKNPHANTGINKLEELLKKIVPTLEDSYKTLTSNKNQRSSFRSHILNAIENVLKPEDAKEDLDSDESPEELEEVEINIKDSDPLGASDEEKFIDISDSEGGDTEEEEEDPIDSFGIEGEDTTGRNAAFEAFKQIENQIIDAYGVLQDPNDRSVFYDYLLTNVKMYFDKFEEELAGVVQEPASDSYQEPVDSETESPLEEI